MTRIRPVATAAQSPAAIEALNAFFGALGKGVLDGKVGERIAITFALVEIVAHVAHVALNVFTNYLNSVAGTEIDFPHVSLDRSA